MHEKSYLSFAEVHNFKLNTQENMLCIEKTGLTDFLNSAGGALTDCYRATPSLPSNML